MRAFLLLMIAAQLTACLRYPAGAEHSEKMSYQPHPSVELSTFTAGDRIVSVYVRHSQGSLLLHLAPVDSTFGLPESELKMVLPLRSPREVELKPVRYEDFEQSVDVFGDGRVVLVPLSDQDGEALGVFVNLMSGDRYFFAPSVKSPESHARIRSLASRWPGLNVIVPEDPRAHDRVARFPEYAQ